MHRNFKDALRGPRPSIGSWISAGNTAVAEILARAGFEWLVIDLEHSTIDLAMAGELIRVIDLCGVAPLVRLTSNDADLTKRVLDAGAHGIVVPMVNSPDEARRAVAATRYAPAGTRGVGLSRAQGYGTSFADYLRWQTDGPTVIVQIEHRDALEHLPDILAVPGVDGLIIGPYDLSCSLGIPGQFDRPEYTEAMRHILETARSLDVPAGLHIVEPDLDRLERTIREGYAFIAYSVDFRMLDIVARAGVARAREVRP